MMVFEAIKWWHNSSGLLQHGFYLIFTAISVSYDNIELTKIVAETRPPSQLRQFI